jgi:hypothetical protein
MRSAAALPSLTAKYGSPFALTLSLGYQRARYLQTLLPKTKSPCRWKMKTPKTIFQDEENPLADGFQDSRKTAYDAGLITGRETGYKLGFQDGFLASLKNRNEDEVVGATDETISFELAPNGKRLVGPPCVNCGHCYPGALTQCPRCKTAAPPSVHAQHLAEPESSSQAEFAE